MSLGNRTSIRLQQPARLCIQTAVLLALVLILLLLGSQLTFG